MTDSPPEHKDELPVSNDIYEQLRDLANNLFGNVKFDDAREGIILAKNEKILSQILKIDLIPWGNKYTLNFSFYMKGVAPLAVFIDLIERGKNGTAEIILSINSDDLDKGLILDQSLAVLLGSIMDSNYYSPLFDVTVSRAVELSGDNTPDA